MDDIPLTERDYDDYKYMTSVAEDTLDREEYSKFHLNLPDMSVKDGTSSTTEQLDVVHVPLTDSHEVKRVKEVLRKEIPQDQFSKIHTDIMSQLVMLQKGQANLRSLLIQLQDRISSMQTDIKTIMNIILFIKPHSFLRTSS
ncbi:hypothetical protein QYM36_013052 [Artemia franciscana]|uniref:Uncharacterized protein n=2 Tax=Artemia franciscana TaxID=6661 RepID=A0AA88KW02_ARTSF|nr:hypothetical protein QYM36_013052 [Artemia franciscana]